MLAEVWISARPRQWVKNGFVLLPVLFSKNLFVAHILARGLAAALVFCVVSSAVYIFNDLMDRERDNRHPLKQERPVAAGRLSPASALAAALLLGVGGIALGFLVNLWLGRIVLGYVVLNGAYSAVLKNIPILDVMVIALGFILRILAGAAITAVLPSQWMILTTFFLALLLGFGKRRGELGLSTGQTAEPYQRQVLDSLMAICAAAAVMSYSLYTIAASTVQEFGSGVLFWTIPFVIFGVFRYFYLSSTAAFRDGPTELLLTDRPLLTCVLLWGALCVVLIYSSKVFFLS